MDLPVRMFHALKWRAWFGRFPRLAGSLQNRLILLVGWLFLLGMWSFVLVLTNHLENDLKDALVAQQSATAAYMANEIESKLRLRLGSLAMIAERVPAKLADAAELQAFLEERRAVYNLFDFGLVVIRPDLHGAWADFPLLAGRRVANWDVPPMRRVIDSGLPAVGVPRIGRFCNKPAVTLAAPIFDAKGQLVAILAGVVGLDAPYFLDSMNRPRDRQLGEVLLVSPQTRQMLFGSRSLLALANMPAPGASPVMDRLLGGTETAVVALDERGAEVLASAQRIPLSGWLVVVRVPTSVAYAPIREHVFAILLIAVVVSLLVALLAAVLIRRSLRPMRQLADTLDAITRGDAPLHALPVAQADEVGRLTESINRLQASLGQEQTALQHSLQEFNGLVERIPVAVFKFRALGPGDFRFDYVSPRWVEMTGIAAEAVAQDARAAFAKVHPENQDEFMREIEAARIALTPFAREVRLLDERGLRWLRIEASPHPLDDGSSLWEGIQYDITERKRAEAHQKLAASVFTNTQEGIVITDADARIVDINEAFTRLTGYCRDEVLGKNPNMLSSGHQSRDFYRTLWQTLLANGHWSDEVWNRRKDGVLYAERLSISAVAVEPGQTSHYVGVFSDITHIKEHQRQLEAIAHYDPLTGVPNRLLLADRMRQAIAQTHRNQDMLAVCYLDLDGFKAVNDHFGHEAGDSLLVEMANRFRNCLRGEDTVARLGGDEFVLLLLGLKGIPECEHTLRRVLEAASQPVFLSQQSVTVSASIGVTLFPRDDEPSETLLRHADQAMYVAKQSGKNRYYLFDPDSDRQARQRHDSLNLVAEALQRREFELYYQPKVNMRTGVVIGAEALIRWRHPERGLLLPGEFLPAIEDSELIVSVGHWVIETALAQLESWHRRGLLLSVSINVAARQLLKPDFMSRLQTSLAQYPQLIPGHVEMEVLETAALEDMAQVSSVIVEGARLGVGFALDDFGTGYSSLAYLKRLPADTLKIDQSFVRDMLRDPEDMAIVEGVIGLTEVFHREVIAEGVETEELGVLLINLGCEMAQGYAIAQPMPASRLPQWVKHWVPPLAWTSAGGFRLPREDLPLIIAEHDHRRWVDALTTLVEGGSIQEPPVMDLHLCRFGRRYDRAANSHYQHRPEYAELGPIHAEVHEIGQAVLALLEAGERDAARLRLQDLYAARDRLVQTLHQLLTSVG